MFKCQKCSCSFSRKDNLLRHIKTHKGERILCKLCDSSFKYSSALKRHEQNVHNKHMSEDPTTPKLKAVIPSSNTVDSDKDDSIILKEIAKAKENIKRKYTALKSGEENVQSLVTQTFKPIIEPLNKISNK